MSEYLRGPVIAMGTVAAAIFIVALLLLIGTTDFGFGSILFLALLITLLASIIVYLAFPKQVEGLDKELPKLRDRAADELPKLRDKAREEFPKIKSRLSEEIPRIKDQAAKARDGISENISSIVSKTRGETSQSTPTADAKAAPAAAVPAAVTTPAPEKAEQTAVEPKDDGSEVKAHESGGATSAEAPDTSGDQSKPVAMTAPDGDADDLKKIKGVGPKLAATLNEQGIYHFSQIASWGDDEVAWMDENLTGFKGRVSRDNWVEQARLLAEGGDTEFSKKVEGGDVY